LTTNYFYERQGIRVNEKKVEVIIFDLDETLIEIPDAYHFFDDIIIITLKKMGISSIPTQEERDRLWRTGKEYIEILKSWGINDPKQFWSIFDEIDFERRKELMVRGEIKPFPDTLTTLERLQSKNYKLAILTNTIKKITDYTLEYFGITPFINFALALGDTQERCKPEPDGVFEILKFFSIPPEKAVMVGDSQNDMEAGFKAKIKCFRIIKDQSKLAKIGNSTPLNYSIIFSLSDLLNLI
jgi:phosphoglycolate phosphatase